MANFRETLESIRNSSPEALQPDPEVFSNLTPAREKQMKEFLDALDPARKAALFKKLCEAAEEDCFYNYAGIGQIGLNDSEGEIREAGIRLLRFEDEKAIAEKILNAALNDPFEGAQLAAIDVLGDYMIAAAMEDPIPLSEKKLRKSLFSLLDHSSRAVAMNSLKAYAFSDDPAIHERISALLNSNDTEEILIGLHAAQNTLNDRWSAPILELITHEEDEVREAAVCAAGALELKEALPYLYELLCSFDSLPEELLLRVVDALSEIGDESSIDVLEVLGEAAADMSVEVTDAIDEAIDSLNITVNTGDFEKFAPSRRAGGKKGAALKKKIANAGEHCIEVLEQKIPRDLDEDEDEDEEEHEHEAYGCECGHHHHHDDPLKGLDPARFKIVEDLQAYEENADRDDAGTAPWMDLENLSPEDAAAVREFLKGFEKKSGKK